VSKTPNVPGTDRPAEKAAGHWLLAQLGKKVLRPGGRETTNWLLRRALGGQIDVVEFAPGLGITALEIVKRSPKTYTGVDLDPKAAEIVRGRIGDNPNYTVVNAGAQETGLPDSSYDVVVGEAMLTMQTDKHKLEIRREAARTRPRAVSARRAFNIKSLAVGETEHPEISRMTIIVDADSAPIEQVVKQLNKLINVLKVVELEPEDSVERRLLMMKVQADETRRTSVLQIVDLFRAHVVDVQPESVVIESIGSLSKLEALLRALEPYGVTELVQSGAVAIGRGDHSITDQLKEN